jgi:hypothetical protein
MNVIDQALSVRVYYSLYETYFRETLFFNVVLRTIRARAY